MAIRQKTLGLVRVPLALALLLGGVSVHAKPLTTKQAAAGLHAYFTGPRFTEPDSQILWRLPKEWGSPNDYTVEIGPKKPGSEHIYKFVANNVLKDVPYTAPMGGPVIGTREVGHLSIGYVDLHTGHFEIDHSRRADRGLDYARNWFFGEETPLAFNGKSTTVGPPVELERQPNEIERAATRYFNEERRKREAAKPRDWRLDVRPVGSGGVMPSL